jgi:uncharacterized protein YbaR (Trm112 family)
VSAPYEPGQLVTANGKRHCCPTCRSADLTLAVVSSAENGIFECRDCGESFIRGYADVTLVDPGTGHTDDDPEDELETAPQTPPTYPAPGSAIPDQAGYVVGECTHRVAASEWRVGFRVCERCPATDDAPDDELKCPLCDHAVHVSAEDGDASLSEMVGHFLREHHGENVNELLARVRLVEGGAR